MAQSEEEKFQDRLKQHLLDDVPQQFKKRPAEETPGQMTEDQLAKRFRPSFFSYTMVATIQKGGRKRANQWASKNEVRKLRTLLDLPIASARFHFGARKRFQRPVNQKGMARVTVMMGEEEGMALVSQESKEEVKKRPGRKTPYLWKGVTLFLHQEDTKPPAKAQPVVVELPDGLYEVMVTDAEEWNSLAKGEIENQAFFEALLLQMKTNGKELDPRFFNQEERKGFEESDRKEWESWVKNQVIRRLSPDEVKEVNKKNIFKAPARVVRVNKGAMHGLFQPKSRMVIPGHLDPHLGQFRSDAPTSMWVCVQLAKAVCAYKHWMALTFDVTTAFLSGKEVDREVLIRAPPEGLPALPEHGEAAVKPGELLRVVKSAYGLSEAPRLWYLRARELLLEIGFEELAMAKATFVMRSKKSQEVQAILCLHVDDGLLVAAPNQAQKIRQAISERFAIKEWKNLAETAETFLQFKTTYKDHTFEDDMTEYINKVEYAPEETEQTKALEGKQLSAFRRLIMQLRWPAHHVLPEYLFRVSDLAQRVGEANGGDLKYANKVLKSMKETASEGKAKTRIPPMKGELLLVSYFDASLGTSKSSQAQQGELHLLTSTDAFHKPAPACILEFHSNRIRRVVRSSLAAEGCAMSSAGDRQLFNRVIADSFLFGKLDISSNWRREIRTKGCLITDAKGLHDHLHKTGGVATERQAALDMLLMKQLIEDEVVGLKWTPTWRQLADPLTKDMSGSLLEVFKESAEICLIQTASDAKEEERRAGIHRAQRERRKERMKSQKTQRQRPFSPM